MQIYTEDLKYHRNWENLAEIEIDQTVTRFDPSTFLNRSCTKIKANKELRVVAYCSVGGKFGCKFFAHNIFGNKARHMCCPGNSP